MQPAARESQRSLLLHVFVAPYEAIAGEAVDPTAWDLFHQGTRARDGFPFGRIAAGQPLSWIWGYSLSEQVPKAIPLSQVFALSGHLSAQEQTDFPIVSGFATATSPAAAAYHGLLEVLERDAFMIAWANQLPMLRLEIDRSTPNRIGEYLAAFEDSGLEARCATLRLDLGAHLVVAMGASSRPGEPARFLAAAADLDLSRACRRAIGELGASWVVVNDYLRQSGGKTPDPVAGQVTTMGDHGRLYARPDMAHHLDIWWDPPGSMPVPDPRPEPGDRPWEQLDRAVQAVGRAGLEVLVVDLTPPEIKELGLWVVKSLVPGTYPMCFDSRWTQLGGRRMAQVPVQLGLREQPLSFDELHQVPHPFP